jgi:hypothetical protein
VTTKTPEWVAGLFDPDCVSRDRLANAFTAANAAAWRWCDQADSGVSRSGLCAAVIASLPEALKLTWQECARRSVARAGRAEFRPHVELLDGARPMLAVPLLIRIDWGACTSESRPDDPLHVVLGIGLGHTANAMLFHEIERDIAPRSVFD